MFVFAVTQLSHSLLAHLSLGGALPEPLVVAVCLWLMRRAKLHASLRDPEDVARLLLSAAFTVAATTATDAVLLALVHASPSTELMLQALGQDLLGNYVGVLLVVPLLVMMLRAPLDKRALGRLLMDGLLVLLPSLAILLVLSSHEAPQPQFARVLSLAPVLFFAFRHGWRGASLAMLISSSVHPAWRLSTTRSPAGPVSTRRLRCGRRCQEAKSQKG